MADSDPALEIQMTETETPKSVNPAAAAALARHLEIIRRTPVDHGYAYDSDRLLREKLGLMAARCERVLDVGQSTREHAALFAAQSLESVDINHGDPEPDIIDDICAPSRLRSARYDGVVCLSVLEHVYDPFTAIAHIHRLLSPGGYLLLHLPFLYRYHAPPGLEFTDCYRFSRDGIAWMLREFSDVRLYSVRGPYSSIFNLNRCWKKVIERRLGMAPSRWLDRLGLAFFRRPGSDLQVSGYYAWGRKAHSAGGGHS